MTRGRLRAIRFIWKQPGTSTLFCPSFSDILRSGRKDYDTSLAWGTRTTLETEKPQQVMGIKRLRQTYAVPTVQVLLGSSSGGCLISKAAGWR